MAKSLMSPISKIFFLYGVLVPCYLYLYSIVWNMDSYVPKRYVKGSELEVALRIICLAALPLPLMVASIMFYRGMTVFGETLHTEEETIYLKVSKMILTNTTEQTLIFIINLLSAAALHSISKEKIVIAAVVHFVARILFWFGYLIGSYFNLTVARAPGFATGMMNNSLLVLFNIQALLNFK